MTRHIRFPFLPVMFLLIVATSTAAQDASSSPQAERSTALGAFVGGASTSMHTGVVLAGTADWQLTPWIGFEARGSWFQREGGSDAFGADLGALVNIVRKNDITPFVGLAFGLYRASFHSPTSPMSSFYRRRMEPALGPRRANLTFTDPALRIAAGVDFIARRHLTVRPEASALIVWRDGRSETMAIFGVRLGYRFEDPPTTQARR